MSAESEIRLNREVSGLQIPSGAPITLEKDLPVTISQSLGGSHTLLTPNGMVRIDAKDADALGLATPDLEEPTSSETIAGEVTEDDVWNQLKTVYDPEIPVNIVDLGLVYSMKLTPLEEGKRIEVRMTLTAPGCGMGPTIQADARSKVMALPGIEEAEVELVWEPPWDQGMITEVGRMKLGLI